MMQLVAWNDAYSVGNMSLDEQHKQILAMINELYTAIKEGHDREAVEPLLRRLWQYIEAHFSDEEQFMREHDYPDFEYHKSLHDRLRSRTAVYLENPNHVVGENLLRFLKSWWLEHIQEEDQQYTPYARMATAGHTTLVQEP